MKTRRRSSSRSKSSGLTTIVRAARFSALTAIALGLASCAIMPSSNRYPAKGDARPHEGVATAHRLPIHGVDISKWQGDVDWAALRQAGGGRKRHHANRRNRGHRNQSAQHGSRPSVGAFPLSPGPKGPGDGNSDKG